MASPKTLRQDTTIKRVNWQDTRDLRDMAQDETNVDAVNPEQIQLIDKQKPDSQQVVKINTQKLVREVNDFPQVKVEKLVRIKNSDYALEQKQ